MTKQGKKALSVAGTELCVSYHLRRAARAVTRLYDTALQPAGLRSTQFAVLVAIAKRAPINVSELEDLLGIDQTTLSRSLRTLQTAGHVSLSVGADRRRRLATLTAGGSQALRRAMPHWRAVQDQVVSQLTDTEWRNIRRSLSRVKTASGRVLTRMAE